MSRKVLAGAVAAVLLAAAVLASLGTGPAEAADEQGVDRLIQVMGTGRVYVTPDMATLDLAVETTAQTARAAQEENARSMRRVVEALKKAGVAEKDIKTTQLALYPLYESPKPEAPGGEQAPKVVGFRAENGVQVTVRKVDAVGSVVDAAVAAGANRIQGISFGLSDPKAWQDRALEEAIADARRQGDLAAKAAGVQIKGVRSINVSGGAIPVYRGRLAAAVQEATPILPGEVTVEVTVNVAYEF